MVRKTLVEKEVGAKEKFRWRGGDVSRIEGFSDAVFAFAITLLVVSLEVPRTFDELMYTMQGFLAFGVCFVSLIMIWVVHYNFFRCYGLEGPFILVLNSVLLFVVLFYIYPLKFLFTFLIGQITGLSPIPPGSDTLIENVLQVSQVPTLMLIYSVGFLAVFLIFVLMHVYAYSKRDELELNVYERFLTRMSIEAYSIEVAIASISIGIAILVPLQYVSFAGWIYCLLGPLHAVHGYTSTKRYNTDQESNLSEVE